MHPAVLLAARRVSRFAFRFHAGSEKPAARQQHAEEAITHPLLESLQTYSR